eukprot:SAG22_NODE_346_length_11892_cov_40.205970_5_plen_122_part_00
MQLRQEGFDTGSTGSLARFIETNAEDQSSSWSWIVDINSDGNQDVYVTNTDVEDEPRTVRLLLGTGAGEFQDVGPDDSLYHNIVSRDNRGIPTENLVAKDFNNGGQRTTKAPFCCLVMIPL